MCKLLVSGDEYVYQYKEEYFLRETGYIMLQRYLNVFEKIRFAGRVKVVESEIELNEYKIKINDRRIEIFALPFFRGPIQYASNYLTTRKLIEKVTEGCDVALFRLPSTAAFACLRIAKNNKIPYAVEVVANPIDIKRSSKKISSRILWNIIHFKQLKACKNAKGVSYVTENVLQKIYPCSSKAFQSYYSSIELENLFFMEQRSIKENHNDIKISHVAHMDAFAKGHETVIKIVKYLVDKGYNATARFAGDGDNLDFFKQKAADLGILDKIEFCGNLNRIELKKFFEKSNIMVFPSSSEGLPRVLIEAMATGLPCLSTPVGGIPELLEENLLFVAKNAKGFSNKIIEIFADKSLYERLSQINIKKSTEFKDDVLAERRTEFYKNLKNLIS